MNRHYKELLRVAVSIQDDIDSMRYECDEYGKEAWFGGFSQYRDDGWGESVLVEWPNLSIMADRLADVLAEIEKEQT